MSSLRLVKPLEEEKELFAENGEPVNRSVKKPVEIVTRSRPHRIQRWVNRCAVTMAPLWSALYDLQMRIGGVRLVQHKLQLPHWPNGVPNLRLGYISDIHYGPTSGSVAPRQAWRILRKAVPDVLLLGGDYLYADERGLPTLIRELQIWQSSPPPGGIYACLGNHDHASNLDALVTCLEACGVKLLVNDAVPLPPPWNGVWLSGVDDMRYGDSQPDKAMAAVPRGACNILLSHSPDICEYSAVKRASLTLCGHTHGGQICLPNGSPLYVPARWGRQYAHGLHRHAGHWIFTSRGVGTVGLPFRLWAPPDVAIIELSGAWRAKQTKVESR